MSKREEILEALKVERAGLRMEEEAVMRRRTCIEALEAALENEDELAKYDEYVKSQTDGRF